MFVNPITRTLERLLLGATLLFVSFAVLATPKIEHWTLTNGTRVYFVEARNLPMVTLNVVFDAGSARDPQGSNGLSMLTNHLLNYGTGELDADAIAATFEGLGAEFGSSNDRDMAGVSLRSLSDRALLDPALDLFARVLAAPACPAARFERDGDVFVHGDELMAHAAGLDSGACGGAGAPAYDEGDG